MPKSISSLIHWFTGRSPSKGEEHEASVCVQSQKGWDGVAPQSSSSLTDLSLK